MLQVTKIIEGGIDLTSGEKIDQGIIISNGYREVMVPVQDSELERVVRLYVEAVEANVGQVPSMPEETIVPKPVAVGPQTHISLAPNPAPPPSGDSDYDEPPPSSDLEDDGFEPGEEYSDSGTGVGSL